MLLNRTIQQHQQQQKGNAASAAKLSSRVVAAAYSSEEPEPTGFDKLPSKDSVFAEPAYGEGEVVGGDGVHVVVAGNRQEQYGQRRQSQRHLSSHGQLQITFRRQDKQEAKGTRNRLPASRSSQLMEKKTENGVVYSSSAISALTKSNARSLVPYLIGGSRAKGQQPIVHDGSDSQRMTRNHDGLYQKLYQTSKHDKMFFNTKQSTLTQEGAGGLNDPDRNQDGQMQELSNIYANVNLSIDDQMRTRQTTLNPAFDNTLYQSSFLRQEQKTGDSILNTKLNSSGELEGQYGGASIRTEKQIQTKFNTKRPSAEKKMESIGSTSVPLFPPGFSTSPNINRVRRSFQQQKYPQYQYRAGYTSKNSTSMQKARAVQKPQYFPGQKSKKGIAARTGEYMRDIIHGSIGTSQKNNIRSHQALEPLDGTAYGMFGGESQGLQDFGDDQPRYMFEQKDSSIGNSQHFVNRIASSEEEEGAPKNPNYGGVSEDGQFENTAYVFDQRYQTNYPRIQPRITLSNQRPSLHDRSHPILQTQESSLLKRRIAKNSVSPYEGSKRAMAMTVQTNNSSHIKIGQVPFMKLRQQLRGATRDLAASSLQQLQQQQAQRERGSLISYGESGGDQKMTTTELGFGSRSQSALVDKYTANYGNAAVFDRTATMNQFHNSSAGNLEESYVIDGSQMLRNGRGEPKQFTQQLPPMKRESLRQSTLRRPQYVVAKEAVASGMFSRDRNTDMLLKQEYAVPLEAEISFSRTQDQKGMAAQLPAVQQHQSTAKRMSESLDLGKSPAMQSQGLDMPRTKRSKELRRSDPLFLKIFDQSSHSHKQGKEVNVENVEREGSRELPNIKAPQASRQGEKNQRHLKQSLNQQRSNKKDAQRSPKMLGKPRKKRQYQIKVQPKLRVADLMGDETRRDDALLQDQNAEGPGLLDVRLPEMPKDHANSRNASSMEGSHDEEFQAFNVTDQRVANLVFEVQLDDQMMHTYGRIKVEHRKRPFMIHVNRMPTNPNNALNHRVAVAWIQIDKSQLKKSAKQCFAEDDQVKMMVVDPYLGPKIHQKINLTFQPQRVTKYVYFKFGLLPPAQNLSVPGRGGEELSAEFSDDHKSQRQNAMAPNCYQVKFNIIFGKDNFDEKALQHAHMRKCSQNNGQQHDSRNHSRHASLVDIVEPEQTGEKTNQINIVESFDEDVQGAGARVAEALFAGNNEEVDHGSKVNLTSESSYAATAKQTAIKEAAKSKKKDPEGRQKMFQEIQEILKSYNTKNLQQSISGILNNEEHSEKIWQNVKTLKQLKSGGQKQTNFIYKNAKLAKDAELRNLQPFNQRQIVNRSLNSMTRKVSPKEQMLLNEQIVMNPSDFKQPSNSRTILLKNKQLNDLKLNINVHTSSVQNEQQHHDASEQMERTRTSFLMQKQVLADALVLREMEKASRQNIKVHQQIRSLLDKRDQNQMHMLQVAQKNEQLKLEMREKKQFLLIRQELLKKEKEDTLIELKRSIIKKCWRLHMHAEILLSQILHKLSGDVKKIRHQRYLKFQRKFAAFAIIQACRGLLRRYGDPTKRTKQQAQRRHYHDQSDSDETLSIDHHRRAPVHQQARHQQAKQHPRRPAHAPKRLLPLLADNLMRLNAQQKRAKAEQLSKMNRFDKGRPQEVQIVEPTAPEVALKRREMVRHCFVFVAGVDLRLKGQNKQAKRVVAKFMRDLSKVRALEFRIERYWLRVCRLSYQLKRLYEVRQIQYQALSDMFEKVKGNLLSNLKVANVKQKNKESFQHEICEALENMQSPTKVQALFQYLHWCRLVYDEVIVARRSKLQRGVALQKQDILLGKTIFSVKKDASKIQKQPTVKEGGKKSPSKAKQSSPTEENIDEYYKIYSFDQLRRSDEAEFLPSLAVSPKLMKRLVALHEKFYPKHKATMKQHLGRLNDWLRDPIHHMSWTNTFKYLPSESLMALIILTSVKSNKIMDKIEEEESQKRFQDYTHWFRRKSVLVRPLQNQLAKKVPGAAGNDDQDA